MNKKEVFLDVTEEQREAMRARGIAGDAVPSAGRHTFRRVPPEKVVKREDAKVRVTVTLEAEVFHYVRRQADVAKRSYDEQLNDELRRAMAQENAAPLSPTANELLQNERFLSALKEKLRDAA